MIILKIEEMSSKFDAKQIEDKIYKAWEENGYFKCKIDKSKEPFVIVMPPPNVTGKLHMGHALDNTVQDIFIRYNRMKGVPSLWIPGTDHASIATEIKVVEKLKKEGKTKEQIGREGFLKETWDWKNKYGSEITNQLRKLGCSCDWEKERFTMDDMCSEAVKEVFIRLYEKGLIYRGERLINWCPTCKTSISENEVEYEEKSDFLWHIKYMVQDSHEYLVVATTRPETLFGDSAVAVNPNDERYSHLMGKKLCLPLTDRIIPIIADEYVETEFGTGAVKITPAHDPNDFVVGARHNLEIINIFDKEARLNELAGEYAGQDRFEARKNVVEDLEKQGLLIKTESHVHNVGNCYRCHKIIEPYISMQWFVKMETLAKPAIDAVKNDEIRFIPKRFEKTYFNWMENTQDWCISRQLWWGHRIPAYYCTKCGNVVVSKTEPTVCECGGEFIQDDDTLDTWFSSALWPFSTLSWPNETEEYNYFYPTTTLVTAYDIITFWVSKMIFSGLEYTGKAPFKNVFIHGIVRDAQGRKMSKSLGNGIDPLEVIDNYGTDALRYSLIQNISPGNDIRYIPEKVEAARNFTNKLWNSARFVKMYLDNSLVDNVDKQRLCAEDKWIINKLNLLIKEVSDNIDNFEIGVAIQKIYDFVWFDFCDLYIEMVKPRLYENEKGSFETAVWTLNYVLCNSLKLLHPYMPFITEEVYANLSHNDDSIMISSWPKVEYSFEQESVVIEKIVEVIRQIRNARANAEVAISKKIDIQANVQDSLYKTIFTKSEKFIKKMAGVENIQYIENQESANKDSLAIHFEDIDIYLDFSSVVNKEEKIAKLNEEKEKVLSELKRAEGMLNNESFVSKAPEKLIEQEKQKIAKYTELLKKIETSLEEIK
ncbi:MAG: valine--tRNA ligase [Clostridia bacterium]|nr:valine--tRNA ligase [Clostridia bacterium]